MPEAIAAKCFIFFMHFMYTYFYISLHYRILNICIERPGDRKRDGKSDDSFFLLLISNYEKD